MCTDKTCVAEGAIVTSIKCVILLDITMACCALNTLLWHHCDLTILCRDTIKTMISDVFPIQSFPALRPPFEHTCSNN